MACVKLQRLPRWSFHYRAPCFIPRGCEAGPWELDSNVAPNEVLLKLLPGAKRSSSKSQCHRNAAMETGIQPGPDWLQNRPVSEEVRQVLRNALSQGSENGTVDVLLSFRAAS